MLWYEKMAVIGIALTSIGIIMTGWGFARMLWAIRHGS